MDVSISSGTATSGTTTTYTYTPKPCCYKDKCTDCKCRCCQWRHSCTGKKCLICCPASAPTQTMYPWWGIIPPDGSGPTITYQVTCNSYSKGKGGE